MFSSIAIQAERPVLEAKLHRTDAEIRAAKILDQASQIVLRQDGERKFIFDRVLLKIVELQIQAHDFNGAHNSIKNCGYEYGRNVAFIKLAESLASFGQKEEAFKIIGELGTDHGWQQGQINDGVQLCWIDYLIDSDQLGAAEKSVGELEASVARTKGLLKLVEAYAKGKNETAANRLLKAAAISATKISYEFDHAKALWEIADAQYEVGASDSVALTVDELVKISKSFEDGLTKVRALCEAAIRAARVKDRAAAKEFFNQAMRARKLVNELNKINSLKQIAKAQVTAGLIEDARDTAGLIKHSESDFTRDAYREEVLFDIAVSQAKGGKFAAAIATASTIEHYTQFQNDAFRLIVEQYLKKGDRVSALIVARKISNPSRKAAAILHVATEFAKRGAKDKAKEIANSILLKVSDDVFTFGKEKLPFDFSIAETWGLLYDESGATTGASQSFTINRAAELAAAAMTLTQIINGSEKVDYADSFKEFDGLVVESAARAHAMHDDKKALEWASRIGSDAKADPSDDFGNEVAVQQRVHALVGVAEGLLHQQTGGLTR